MMALLGLPACSPALNWREVRLNEPGLIAMFPCRPVAQSRGLTLAGRSLSPRLHGCESDGRTYAVLTVDVQDPAVVNAVMQALRDTSLAKLDASAGASASTAGWQVPGMTPQPAAGRWRLSRGAPGVASVEMETAVFARGTWVIQASVIGAPTEQDLAGEPFFEGLRFAP
jgi:hypothetical protein